jgi:hypothetical protein
LLSWFCQAPLHCLTILSSPYTDFLTIKSKSTALSCSVEEDPFFDPYNDKISEAKALIGIIEKKIKEVGKMQFFEFDGTPLKPEQAAQEKEQLFNAYEEKKKKAEQLLEKREKELKRQVEWRRRIGTEFTLINVDDDTTSCSYRVRFYGQDDAYFVEDLLVAKDDWGGT